MVLSLIVAVAENGVIGHQGDLPWRLSADLKRFKQITMGHTLMMGRKTFESIGRRLPGRRSIIITRQKDFAADGCDVARSWPEAVKLAEQDREAFVIGGCGIYHLALRHVQRMYWTQVLTSVEGDVVFPPVDWDCWQLVSEESHPADDRNDHSYRFRVYDRA